MNPRHLATAGPEMARSTPLELDDGFCDRSCDRLATAFDRARLNLDLTNNLWLGNVQRLDVFHGIFPSYFTNTADGIFNPFFAFYGGSMYALLGVLSVLLGGSVVGAQDLS